MNMASKDAPNVTVEAAGGLLESADAVELLVETDPSFEPSGRSKLLVDSVVLEPEELSALLSDLDPLLT